MKLHLSSLICGAGSARDAAEADAHTSNVSQSGSTHRGHDVRVSSGEGREPTSNAGARRGAFGRLGRAMRNALPGRSRTQRQPERPQGPPERVPLQHYLNALRASERPQGEASAGGSHAGTGEHQPTGTHASTSAPVHDPETHEQMLRIKAGFDAKRQAFDERMGIASHPKSKGFLACFGKIGGSSSRPSQLTGGGTHEASSSNVRTGDGEGRGGSGRIPSASASTLSESVRTEGGSSSGRTQGSGTTDFSGHTFVSELSESMRSEPRSDSEPSLGSGSTGFSDLSSVSARSAPMRSEEGSASERSLGSGTTALSESATSGAPTSERSGSAPFSPLRSSSDVSSSASAERAGEGELPSLTQAASEVQLALAVLLRNASPEVREGSAQAGALLREEPVALPLTPIAQHVRNALDQAAHELSTPSETETFASAHSHAAESEPGTVARRHEPVLERSPSQSSDEDAAFFRQMENELGHHVPTTSNVDDLGAAFFDRLMSESPRHSDAGSDVHRDWQIVPQGHHGQDENAGAGLSEHHEMVPAFAPEHRPAYHVELPTDSDSGSSHHVLEGAVGRHDPNAPRIEEITSPRTEGTHDHIVIDIPSDSSSSGTSSIASTPRAGGATGTGATGRIVETGETSGAAPPSRIAQAVGSVRVMLQNIMSNNFSHPLPRWGANIAHAAMRDGATVFVATALREVVGYLVQQATTRGTDHARALGPEQLRASEHAQVLASAGIIAGVAGLNLLSLAHNARGQRQTARSVTSQAFNLAALGAASAAAYGTGTLGTIMPLLAKAVAYTGIRDSLNLFTQLQSNRETLAPHASESNMAANWSEMLVYSANQFVVSTLQNRPPAHSGTSSWSQEHSLHHVIPNLLAFAAANAGGEIADGVTYPALEAFADAGGGRAGLHAMGQTRLTASLRTPMSTAAAQNIPTAEVIARHLLGPFTARTTMFATLYATAGALSRLHPTHHINENGVTQVTTAILSALTGLLVVPFITSLDTGAAPQHENEERDLEMGEHRPA